MKIEDLADELGDAHGVTQMEMEGYLLEQVDDVVVGQMQTCELFAPRELAEAKLTRQGETLLRRLIAEQFA